MTLNSSTLDVKSNNNSKLVKKGFRSTPQGSLTEFSVSRFAASGLSELKSSAHRDQQMLGMLYGDAPA